MKKVLAMSALLALGSTQVFAANDLESAFKESKVMGQFRAFYIDRNYESGTTDIVKDRSAFAIGGKFGFETAAVNGLKFGIMAYTTNAIDPNRLGPTASGGLNPHLDPSLFGKDRKSVTYIGQLYLNYSYKNTNVKIGRQEINTPMAGMDDARMLPNLFEGVVITNKDLPKTTLIGAHFWNMAYGTFANAYSACSYLGLQAGYGCSGYTNLTIRGVGLSKYDTGNFMNMGKQAIGKANAGVTVLAAIYEGIPNLKLQAWDYYAWDMMNILYLQGDYNVKVSNVKTTISAQYINETNVGSKVKDVFGKEVGANLFGAKINFNIPTPVVDNFNLYAAYSVTGSDTNKLLNGGLITPWGGTPGFVQGTVTRLGYVADTNAWKVGTSFDIIKGLNLHLAYSYFNIGSKAVYSSRTHDASETNWDLTWKCRLIKNLEVRARGIYTWNFIPGQNFTEYRLIANYNF
ncbi:OprD family outer membrane porin [Sulfurihydrogenibium sp.]|uniref:OprD family outer membrane porin n=1 Tax=Sulfurihydrogenibium sp. TaxID=2053621 RepID=UPI00260D0D34|nr:OprD family outer membrane porin [Sulfurihydrogenibium sp.]